MLTPDGIRGSHFWATPSHSSILSLDARIFSLFFTARVCEWNARAQPRCCDWGTKAARCCDWRIESGLIALRSRVECSLTQRHYYRGKNERNRRKTSTKAGENLTTESLYNSRFEVDLRHES